MASVSLFRWHGKRYTTHILFHQNVVSSITTSSGKIYQYVPNVLDKLKYLFHQNVVSSITTSSGKIYQYVPNVLDKLK
jgi:hypothetical protein